MWQNNISALDRDEQAISIGNDRHTKLWQTICRTPALFQAAHQPNQHPPCALGCPLTDKPRHTSELQHLWSTTDSQVSSPERKNCSKLKCDWKIRGTAQAPCAPSGWQLEVSCMEIICDILWKPDPSYCPQVTKMGKQKSLGKCSHAAALCPGEIINSLSNVLRRDPTQFLTTIWALAWFPVLNFPSHTTLSALVYRWVILLTSLSSCLVLLYWVSILCFL